MIGARTVPVDSGFCARHPWVPYAVPFIVFMLLLAGGSGASWLLGRWEPVVRFVILTAVLWIFSRSVIDLRVRFPFSTIAAGLAVFAIWIGPDLLIPEYRNHWLFQNSITGTLSSSIPAVHRDDVLVLGFRTLRAVVLVPIIEELFWRAFLMRWLVRADFEALPLGAYNARSMWLTAILFASEHGPYWDVGLIAGFIYNGWMIRTKSLGDCIFAHAITNGALAAYVLATGNWEYWM